MKKPNVQGPRCREKFTTTLNETTFLAFKKKYPQYKSLTLDEFKVIVRTFNELLINSVIDNRNGIELPEGLGFIFIGTCQTPKKKFIMDYGTSNKTGVKTSHKNWESDNNLMKIFYSNYNTKHSFQHKQVWAFRPGKPFRHKASVAYKEQWTKYIPINPTEKVSVFFDRNRRENYKKNLKLVIPEGYDEFKL